MLTPGLLLKLEHCQSWFLKHVFHVPSFAPGLLLLNPIKPGGGGGSAVLKL